MPPKVHRDDKEVSFDTLKREFRADPHVGITFIQYRSDGTGGKEIGLFWFGDVIQFRENDLLLKKKGCDEEYIIHKDEPFYRNWFANRMGYIIRVFRD